MSNLYLCYFSAAVFKVFLNGAEGGHSPVGKTQARNPTAKPEVGRGLLGKRDLGPAKFSHGIIELYT